jgi:hypothetical protein
MLTDAKFPGNCTSFRQANADFREAAANANAGGLMVVVENYRLFRSSRNDLKKAVLPGGAA